MSLKTLNCLQSLEIEFLPHPPYSPDLSPTDYHFFKHLDRYVIDKVFKNETEVKNAIEDFITSRKPDFFAAAIEKLATR